MNEYRGKHSQSVPWALSSTASSAHYRSRHLQRNRRRNKWIIVFMALLIIVVSFPFLSPLFLQVNRVSLPSEDLPSGIGRMKIVFVSDVHYGFFFSDARVQTLVSTINDLKPDLVIFGGDMGDSPDAAVSFYQKLPSIHARYAALGVLGEADHGQTELETSMVTDAMRTAGIIPLVNEIMPVRIGTNVIYVAGLDDMLTGKPAVSNLASSVSVGDYVIFVSHNPSMIPDSQRAADASGRLGWYDLALFGHTHGGQIAGFSWLLDIAGDVPDRYQHGLLEENRSTLLISNGVGTSVIPVRLFCPPEIHCIEVSLP